MLYRAKVSFSGLVTMRRNEVKELTEEAIIKDLLNAGYIEIASGTAEKVESPKKKTTKKK